MPSEGGSISLPGGSRNSLSRPTASSITSNQSGMTKAAMESATFKVHSSSFALSSHIIASVKYNAVVLLLEHLQFLCILFSGVIPWGLGWERLQPTIALASMDPSLSLGFPLFLSVYCLFLLAFAGTSGIHYLVMQGRIESRYLFLLSWAIQLLTSPLLVPIVSSMVTFFDCVDDPESETFRQVLYAFPDVPCWEGATIALPAISGAFLIVYVPYASVVNLLLFDSKFRSGSLLARPSGRQQVYFILARVAVLIVFKVGRPFSPFFPVSIYTAVCLYLFYRYLQKLPYYNHHVNLVALSSFGVSLFASLAAILACAIDDPDDSTSGYALIVSVVVGGLFGAAACMARLKFFRNRTKELLSTSGVDASGDTNDAVAVPSDFGEETAQNTAVHRALTSPDNVEICTRFVLLPSLSREEQYGQVKAIVSLGAAMFPHSAVVANHYARVLLSYKGDGLGAMFELRRVEGARTAYDVEYMSFTLDRIATKAVHERSLGAGVMDAANFVEFQRQLKQAKYYHLEALQYLKRFWGMLCEDDVDISDIPSLTSKISSCVRKAESCYDSLIQKFPNSKPLLRSLAHFQEDVKHDYGAANMYYQAIVDIDEQAAAEFGTSTMGGTTGDFTATTVSTSAESIAKTQRYRAQVQSRKSVAVTRLAFMINLALVLLIAASIVSFVLIDVEARTADSAVQHVANAGFRSSYLLEAIISVREMERAASTSNVELYNQKAAHATVVAEELRNMHFKLYEDTARTSFSNEDLDQKWISPVIPLKVQLGDTTETFMKNQWDAGNLFVNKALELATLSPEEILLNKEAARFLMDNRPSLLEVLATVSSTLESIRVAAITTMLISQASVAMSYIALVLLLGIVCFRPSLSAVRTEMTQTLGIFLTIPKPVVKRMYKELRVTVDFDDEADEEIEIGEKEGKEDKEDGKEDKKKKKKKKDNMKSGHLDADSKDTGQIYRSFTIQYTVALAVIALFPLISVAVVALFDMDADILREVELTTRLDSQLRDLQVLFLNLASVNVPVSELTLADNVSLSFDVLAGEMIEKISMIRTTAELLKFGDNSPGVDRRGDVIFNLLYNDPCVQDTCFEEWLGVVGIDAVLSKYLAITSAMPYYPSESMAPNMTEVILASDIVNTVLSVGLQELSQHLVDLAVTDHKWMTIVGGINFALSTIVILSIHVFVFMRMVSYLRVEAAKTGALLLMIPPEIIEKVEAIRTFLETGVAIDESELLMQNLAAAKVINEAVMNHSALDPLIVIESEGIVSSFNRPAEQLLGYRESEVVGHNVSMLMPPEIAAHHNEYLHTYLVTDNRKMVGASTKVQARHKNGSFIPVELSVDEVVLSGKRMYTGIMKDLTKLANTIKKMEEQKQFSNSIIDYSSTGIIVSDEKGIIIRLNKTAEAILGWPQQEAKGKNVAVLMPAGVAQHHQGYMDTYVQTGVKKAIDQGGRSLQALHRKGHLVTLMLWLSEAEINDKRAFVAYFQDDTENAAKNKRLKDDKLFNESIVDNSASGIVVSDVTGTVLRFNAAAEKIFQYSAEEVKGHNVRMLMPRKYAEQHDSYVETYVRTGVKRLIGKKAIHVEGQRKDSTICYIDISLEEVSVGASTWFTAFITDVSERHNLEKTLKEEQQFHESIMTSHPNGIVIIDDHGIVTQFSTGAARLFHYSSQEMVGQNVKLLMPPGMASMHDGYIKNYKRTGVRRIIGTSRVVQAKRRDGKELHLELTVAETQALGKSYFIGFFGDSHAMTSMQQLGMRQRMAENVLQDMAAPLVMSDDRGTILKFNAAAEKVFGHAAEDVVGGNVKRLMPERYARSHDGWLARYKTTGVKKMIGRKNGPRVQGLHRSGQEVDLEIYVAESKVAGGTVFTAHFKDITETVQQEHVAARTDVLTSTLLDASPSAVVVASGNGTIHWFSAAAARLFGHAKGDVVGRSINLLMPRRVGDKHDGYLSAYAKTRQRRIVDQPPRLVDAIKATGQEFPVSLAVTSVDVNDKPWFVAFVTDETETVEETRLAEQEAQRMMAVLQHAAVPLVISDDQGVIVRFNAAAEKLLQYEAKEVMGKNVSVLMSKHVARLHNGFIEKYNSTGKGNAMGKTRRVQAMRKDKSMVHVELGLVETRLHGAVYYTATMVDVQEEVQAANQAALDEELRAAVMNTSGVVVMNADGVIMTFNKGAEALFGYDEEEALGRDVTMLMTDVDAARHHEYVRTYVETGVSKAIGAVDRRVKAVHKNGSQMDIFISIGEILVGSQLSFVAFMSSVAEHQETQTQVAAERSMVQAVVRASGAAVVVIDAVGRITQFQENSVKSVFGWNQKDVLGKNVSMLMPERLARQHDKHLATYARTGGKKVLSSGLDTRGLRSDGAEIDIHVAVSEATVGGRVFFTGVITDRTEEVAAAKASSDRKATVTEVLDTIEESVVSIDSSGTVLTYNKAAERLFGRMAGEVVGRNVKVLMPPRAAARHDDYIAKYLTTGKATVVGNSTRQTALKKNGKEVSIDISVSETVLDDGGTVFVAVMTQAS